MSEQINRETRLPYAKFNGSVITGDVVSSRGAKWVRVWIYLLNQKDREGAGLVRVRNMKRESDDNVRTNRVRAAISLIVLPD